MKGNHPLYPTPSAARTSLQIHIDSARAAHNRYLSCEMEQREVIAAVQVALGACEIAATLQLLGREELHTWRRAACDPGAATPLEHAQSVLRAEGLSLTMASWDQLVDLHQRTKGVAEPVRALVGELAEQEIQSRCWRRGLQATAAASH